MLKVDYKAYKEMHKVVDETVNEHASICKKGCSYCCHQFVPVLSFEVSYTKEAIKDLPTKIKRQVKNQYQICIDHFMENTADEEILKMNDVWYKYGNKVAEDNIKCPLLINNECSIYENRPLVCRTHFQIENRELCIIKPDRDRCNESVKIMMLFMDFMLKQDKYYQVPLLYLLKDVLDKKRIVKKIETMTF